MFRVKKEETIVETNVVDGESTENIGLSPVVEATAEEEEVPDRLLPFNVTEVLGIDGPTYMSAENVNTIKIDRRKGLEFTDLGRGEVFITFPHRGIYVIDASDESPELPTFLDMLENPQHYRGAIVYLLDVGPTERPDPFLWKDKFYFNEGSEWFESPLALGRVLDELE